MILPSKATWIQGSFLFGGHMLEKLFVKVEEKRVVWLADRLYGIYFITTAVGMTVTYLEGAIWSLIFMFVLWVLASGIWLEWKNG
jgi:hypothetical protein